jgi:hypothetical protein
MSEKRASAKRILVRSLRKGDLLSRIFLSDMEAAAQSLLAPLDGLRVTLQEDRSGGWGSNPSG